MEGGHHHIEGLLQGICHGSSQELGAGSQRQPYFPHPTPSYVFGNAPHSHPSGSTLVTLLPSRKGFSSYQGWEIYGSKLLQGLVLRLWVPGSQLPRSTFSTLTWSIHLILRAQPTAAPPQPILSPSQPWAGRGCWRLAQGPSGKNQCIGRGRVRWQRQGCRGGTGRPPSLGPGCCVQDRGS